MNVDGLSLVKRMRTHACRSLFKVVPRARSTRPVFLLTKDLFNMVGGALAMHLEGFYWDGGFPSILDG